MALITMNVPESFTNGALDYLRRIAEALERLAGPKLAYDPKLADIRDLSNVHPDELARIQEAQEEFASAHMLVPGSPAFLSKVAEFERHVAEVYGPDAVSELPWKARPSSPETL